MRLRLFTAALSGTIVLSILFTPVPALAVCKKLGFTVNHYGKDGPTEDAKRLLDGYLASWTKERGIKKFRTKGEKTVSCYKFLDLGFFDEWTCKAVQEICFRGKTIPDVIAKKGAPATTGSIKTTGSKPKSDTKKTLKTASKSKSGKKSKPAKKYSKHYTRRMKYKKRPKVKAKQEG